MNWVGLTAKPRNWKALVIFKGEVIRREVEIKGDPITLLQGKPINYSGNTYNAILNEQEQIKEIEAQAKR